MAEPKTKETDVSVDAFLDDAPSDGRRRDSYALIALMSEVTGEEPRMWGPSIIGFGRYAVRYANGSSADWPIAGFSPRKQALTVYLASEYPEREGLLARLGPHKVGKSCLYLKRLSDVDVGVLRELVVASVAHTRAHGGC